MLLQPMDTLKVLRTLFATRITTTRTASLLAIAMLVSCSPATRSTRPAPTALAHYTTSGTHYQVAGPIDGSPVILVHASGVDLRMWDREVALLSPYVRVVRYDLRAHGRTRVQGASVAPYEQLRELVDHLGYERVSLIGLSAGALVATDFAVAYPSRVTNMVLASPNVSGYVPTASMAWFAPIAAAARAGKPNEAAALFSASPLMVLDTTQPGQRARAEELKTIILENAQVWSDTTRGTAGLTPPAIGRLESISAQTMVIIGENDRGDIPLVADALFRGIAGARLVTIPGAGHMVNFADPDGFGRAVLAFFRP